MKFNIHNVNKQCPGPTKGPALINIPPQPRGPGDETRDEREELTAGRCWCQWGDVAVSSGQNKIMTPA